MSKKTEYARVIGHSKSDTHEADVSRAKLHMIGTDFQGDRIKDPNDYEIEAVSVVRCENHDRVWWDAVIIAKYPLINSLTNSTKGKE